MTFTQLQVHSNYTLLHSPLALPDLIQAAKNRGCCLWPGRVLSAGKSGGVKAVIRDANRNCRCQVACDCRK